LDYLKKMTQSLISRIEQHVRDLINEVANSAQGEFLPSIKTLLKFENESDWITICSLLDVIGDTELAKDNFRKFKIEGPTKIEDFGERYLRLYGILNAVYLQHSAVESFLEIIKYPAKNAALKDLNDLKILELRNKAGAHTVDYLGNDRKKNPHQISRGIGDNTKIETLDSNNVHQEYDLHLLLNHFDDTVEYLLLKGAMKFVSTVFKNNSVKKAKYLRNLNAFEKALETGILIGFEGEPIFMDFRRER
jgi:hypothetical protein